MHSKRHGQPGQKSTDSLSLRSVTEEDIGEFYAQRLARAAAAGPPPERAQFIDRWHRMLADSNAKIRTIAVGPQAVGYIAHFRRKDLPEVSYELGRQHWGKGFATSALRLFLQEISVRPLYARALKSNVASVQVLEKCGFTVTGEDRFTDASGAQIEEFILTLGEGASS